MNCKLVQPPDYLKRYVRYFWVLEGGSNDSAPITFVALPDGCPGMILGRQNKGHFQNLIITNCQKYFCMGKPLSIPKLAPQGSSILLEFTSIRMRLNLYLDLALLKLQIPV